MAERVIPLADHRYAAAIPRVPAVAVAPTGRIVDRLGRPLGDLRISVTDRCNFRCGYCMPREVFGRDYAFLPQSSLLDFEEIARVASLFVAHGVEKIRLTGGEPLLRKGLERLVEMLAALQTPSGRPLDLTLTTNGSLLAKKARALRDAGLGRVTVSLDALDDAVFRRMNDADFPVADVLAGIDAAIAAGLPPLKVNMVVKRGTNDGEIVPMARHFRGSGIVLRFIEYMDVGASNGWRMDEVLPSAEVVERLSARLAAGGARRAARRRDRRTLALPSTAAARSASSPASRRPSAATATAPACRPRASCSCACSPRAGTTCGRCCAAAGTMRRSLPPSASSGRTAATAIRSCAARCLRRRARSPRPHRAASRCTTSAADEASCRTMWSTLPTRGHTA